MPSGVVVMTVSQPIYRVEGTPQLFAHGDSHGDRNKTQDQKPSTEPSPVAIPSILPDTNNKTEAPTSLEPIESPPAAVSQPFNLFSSHSGPPLQLGELSLALILMGPICLFAFRRWLQS